MTLLTISWLKKLKRTDSILNVKYRKQLFATIIVNIITYSHGVILGWSAPTLKILTSEKTPLSFMVSVDEASWIGSLIGLGSLTGNLLLGNAVDFIGRKPCLIINALPHMFAWILIYTAKCVEYLYIARFIGGITGGISITVVSLFLGEISDKSCRGAFAGSNVCSLGLGYLSGYIICSLLSYFIVPFIAILLPLIYLLLVFQLPDTPQYLLRKGKHEAALLSFMFYKNTKNALNYQQEFEELKASLEACNANTKLQLSDFVTKAALKAYATSIVIILLFQSSGIYTFTSYMSDIFAISGAPSDPNTSTIIIGVVQLFGYIAAAYFVDQFGRRKLLITSASGVVVGLMAFGCYTHLKMPLNLNEHSWIPLAVMIFVVFIGSTGVSALYLIVLIEILPTKIRSYALSGCLTFLSVIIFISLKFFPICMHKFGISVTMWALASLCSVCLLYISIFLPETKGKSIDGD